MDPTHIQIWLYKHRLHRANQCTKQLSTAQKYENIEKIYKHMGKLLFHGKLPISQKRPFCGRREIAK